PRGGRADAARVTGNAGRALAKTAGAAATGFCVGSLLAGPFIAFHELERRARPNPSGFSWEGGMGSDYGLSPFEARTATGPAALRAFHHRTTPFASNRRQPGKRESFPCDAAKNSEGL